MTSDIARTSGTRIEIALGAALILLGALVAAGWVLRVPALVRLHLGETAMVFTTALGFLLSGGFLAVASMTGAWRRILAPVLAASVLGLAGIAAIQYPLGVDLGIDFPALHRWLQAGEDYPGRPSPFTSIAFVAAGLAMLLACAPSRRLTDAVAASLASTVGLIGLGALAGYAFDLGLIYPDFPFRRVAGSTAAGLLALCAALWLYLLREGRVRFWGTLAAEDRITFSAAAMLTVAALSAGVGTLAVLQARVGDALRESLAMSLQFRAALAQYAIEAGVQRSRMLVGRPAPARALRRLITRPKDAEAIAQLAQSAESLVKEGYLAARYYDLAGREVVAFGQTLRAPPLSVPLGATPGATLAWEDRFVVSGRYVLADERGPVGSSLVETLVPALDSLSQDNVRLGTTGEVGLCARVDERLACFPQRRNPRVYFTPLSIGGAPFPMARAVAAESGVLVAEDYRRHYAMAAYGPVGPYGLGMVVKIDTAEVYGPLRERLRIILAMLFALVAAGTWLLRAAVRPLAERLARSENVAREQYRALEATMMNVADGMMLMDRDGTIRFWNRSAEKLFGYSASEVIGGNVSMLVPESLREKNIAATRRFVATGESGVLGQPNVSYPARRKDGSTFELEFTLTEVPHDGGARLVAVFRDISERKRAEERLTQLALFDDLTGLANRVSFNRRLQDAIARRRRSEDLLAVLYLDLDRLKPVNDTLGHDAGDALLIAFAKRLTAAVRETDMVARLGGDEFGIVMEGLKAPENATSVVNKIFLSLRDPVEIGGNRLVASTSIGIALYRSGDTRETLMKRADAALYEAKRAGRGRHRFAA